MRSDPVQSCRADAANYADLRKLTDLLLWLVAGFMAVSAVLGSMLSGLTFISTGSTGAKFDSEDVGEVVPQEQIPNGWLFDFGTSESPVAKGYTRVTPLTRYSDELGYGWMSGNTVTAEDHPGPGTNILRQDFNSTRDATFVVDLPNGHYTVYLTLGDKAVAHVKQKFYLENVLRLIVTTQKGEFVAPNYRVRVTDGRLDLRVTGITDAVINSMEIQPVGDTHDIR